MTFQGDQQSIISESGSAEDDLVSVATSTAPRGFFYCPERPPPVFTREGNDVLEAGRVTWVRNCPTRWPA